MKVYKGEAIVTLVVPVIVVEPNSHKAQKTIMNQLRTRHLLFTKEG